jgi:ADP-heptose:LPS heptosyltransferase
MDQQRKKAFFINGGAGRVLCSIPAFEKYYEESGDKDFIIICEGGTELFKGHPFLDIKSYDHWHKNIFADKIKNMDVVTPEPYRVWEYYNQKCSLSQAFDIEINGKGIRDLPLPKLNLSKEELSQGNKLISEVKEKIKKTKVAVFQPFGRGVHETNGIILDSTGRSMEVENVVSLVKKLQENGWAVILFSELKPNLKEANLKDEIAQPDGATLRIWTSIIKHADLFIGCDSVGQHLAKTLNTPSVVVLGSTFPINVSYPETERFKVVDLGENIRQYSPIRIVMDEAIDRNNERLMYMTNDIEDYIIDVCKKLTKNTNSKKER